MMMIIMIRPKGLSLIGNDWASVPLELIFEGAKMFHNNSDDDITSFRVQEDCEEPSLPSQPPRAQPFTGGDDDDDDNSNDVMLHRGRVHRLPAPAPPRLCGQDRPEGWQGRHQGGHQGACHQHRGPVQAAITQWAGSGGQGGSGDNSVII